MKEIVISNTPDGSPHRGGDAQRAEGVSLFDKILYDIEKVIERILRELEYYE